MIIRLVMISHKLQRNGLGLGKHFGLYCLSDSIMETHTRISPFGSASFLATIPDQ